MSNVKIRCRCVVLRRNRRRVGAALSARLSDYHRREQYRCPALKSERAHLVDFDRCCESYMFWIQRSIQSILESWKNVKRFFVGVYYVPFRRQAARSAFVAIAEGFNPARGMGL